MTQDPKRPADPVMRAIVEGMKKAIAGRPTVLDRFYAEQAERNRKHDELMAWVFSLPAISLPQMPDFSEFATTDLTPKPDQ